jgi:hypothetical protein
MRMTLGARDLPGAATEGSTGLISAGFPDRVVSCETTAGDALEVRAIWQPYVDGCSYQEAG